MYTDWDISWPNLFYFKICYKSYESERVTLTKNNKIYSSEFSKPNCISRLPEHQNIWVLWILYCWLCFSFIVFVAILLLFFNILSDFSLLVILASIVWLFLFLRIFEIYSSLLFPFFTWTKSKLANLLNYFKENRFWFFLLMSLLNLEKVIIKDATKISY